MIRFPCGDCGPGGAGHIGDINYHQRLDQSPTSPRSARGLVRDALLHCPQADVRDTVELLTSELVTNALLHAQSEVVLHVETGVGDRPGNGCAVHVAVDDGSDRAPVVGDPGSSSLGGRGLPLVALLASRWGWEPLGSGKRVWFEV